MDDWGWRDLEPGLIARVALPIGPLFCVINGRTRGRPWTTSGARAELRRAAARAGVRRRFAPNQLRHATRSRWLAKASRPGWNGGAYDFMTGSKIVLSIRQQRTFS
jgi:hypothetical protein